MFEPIHPLSAVTGSIRLGQLMGADDLWFADHTKSLMPKVAWDPVTNPMARLVPDLDAYFDPTAIIARYAGRRGTVMGTAVTDAIRRTPADLARAWLSMHHLSKGRVILGIGSGEAENVVPYGQSMTRSVTRLEDTVVAIRAAWTADDNTVTDSGPFHSWQDATFALPAYRTTYPPIWVGAQGPRACRIAGRHGDGWIHIHENFERWVTSWNEVAVGAREAGRDPSGIERSLLVAGLLVANQRDYELACDQPTIRAVALAMRGSAWSDAGAEHPLGRDFGGYAEHNPVEVTKEKFDELGKAVTPELFHKLMPSGSAEQISGYIAKFVRAGVTHVTILNFTPTCGIKLAAKSLIEQRKLISRLKAMTSGAPAHAGKVATR
jgi:phthiodiolone/phenolphthiodiolone dimycocerosates ketoreductase